MSWRLRNHVTAPPGGYIYEQTEGIQRKFKTTFDINLDAKALADFREGNNLPGASFAEALEAIDAYTCQRIGNMRKYCYNTDATYAETTPKLQPKGCSGCGAKVK